MKKSDFEIKESILGHGWYISNIGKPRRYLRRTCMTTGNSMNSEGRGNAANNYFQTRQEAKKALEKFINSQSKLEFKEGVVFSTFWIGTESKRLIRKHKGNWTCVSDRLVHSVTDADDKYIREKYTELKPASLEDRIKFYNKFGYVDELGRLWEVGDTVFGTEDSNYTSVIEKFEENPDKDYARHADIRMLYANGYGYDSLHFFDRKHNYWNKEEKDQFLCSQLLEVLDKPITNYEDFYKESLATVESQAKEIQQLRKDLSHMTEAKVRVSDMATELKTQLDKTELNNKDLKSDLNSQIKYTKDWIDRYNRDTKIHIEHNKQQVEALNSQLEIAKKRWYSDILKKLRII